MATVAQDDHAFGRGSPVLAYWLAHSEGFRVRGRRRAVVAGVLVQPPGRVTALTLRGPLGRRRLVPADAIEAVVPQERLLVVGRTRSPRDRRAQAARLGARAATNAAFCWRLGRQVDRIAARVLLALARAGLRKARDGDAAWRWIAREVGSSGKRAGAVRSAISRCSSSAAADASAAASYAAERVRAARSSRRFSSSSPRVSPQRSSRPPQPRA